MSSQDLPATSLKNKTTYSYPLKQKAMSSLPYTLAVTLIGLIAFWIRILPSNTIFLSNGFVKFVTNDAWYHVRTLHLLINNYPHGIFFNPMTNYPYGSDVHFGPLFDQIMAIISLVLGLGHPSWQLVDHVAAYFPAVLGALTVVPVYYIGKYIGGRKTGILASILIAFAPGQFLSRSMIGFVDHHVAETLFSTLFMMFFMLALISAKKNKIRFEDFFNKKFDALKEPLLYSIIAGIMYSAYQLIWPGAPLFALIAVVYAVFQYMLNNLRKESSDYLGIIGIPVFLISALLTLPFVHFDIGFSMQLYSWFHIAVALGGIAVFVVLSLVEKEFVKRKLDSRYYPLAILGIGILGLIGLSLVAPSLYTTIITAPDAIFGIQTGGPSTIGEASSIYRDKSTGLFTLGNVFSDFTPEGYFASIIGMLILAAHIFRKPKSEELLIFVWSFIIFLAIYGQNRFGYYYSVNVSILSAYVGGLLLEKVKWNELDEKFKANVKSFVDIPGFFKFLKIEQVIAVLALGIILIYPVYGSAMMYTHGNNDPSGEWLEACTWLSSNTPDPGMDYNAIYDTPKSGELFKYPDKAYGVMSWWDYGHYIEVIGHRMPNANPFQAGIGGRRTNINETNIPGAAPFLLAPSEAEASAVLEAIDPRPEKAGARYIVTSKWMAVEIFDAMFQWTLDTEGYYQAYWTGSGYEAVRSARYFNSMLVRLHLFDGNGMKQYRLVHETWADQTNEVYYKQLYNFIFEGNIPAVNTGYIKIFEYVKGAKVTGTASANETVTISAPIVTGQNRTFAYSQSTTSDSQGRYEFTVPYSTEGPISGETQFDTAPSGPYILSYGSTTKEVKVSEEAVLKGEEIKV